MGHCRTAEGWDHGYISAIGLSIKDIPFSSFFPPSKPQHLHPEAVRCLSQWDLSDFSTWPTAEELSSVGIARDLVGSIINQAKQSLVEDVDSLPPTFRNLAKDLLTLSGYEDIELLDIQTSGPFTLPLNLDEPDKYTVEVSLLGKTMEQRIMFVLQEDDWFEDPERGQRMFECRLVAAMLAARYLNEKAGFMCAKMYGILMRGTGMTFYKLDMDSAAVSEIMNGAKDNSTKGTIYRYQLKGNDEHDVAFAVRKPTNMEELLTCLAALREVLRGVLKA
ncbi:hypothetical protein HDV05_007193 [Chytridiales sp. JEL 0842]|nr:hypothetical protein HDV05_007193 [Chytridiales sp. JEL 0842]